MRKFLNIFGTGEILRDRLDHVELRLEQLEARTTTLEAAKKPAPRRPTRTSGASTPSKKTSRAKKA